MENQRRKRPTIKDIATAAGLSVSTVSEILHQKKQNYSSEKTRERVFAIASSLGYYPNFGYKVMTRQRTQTAAIVVPHKYDRNEEMTKKLILILTEKFEVLGYASYVCTLPENPIGDMTLIQDMISRGVAHFVLLGTPCEYEKIIAQIEADSCTYIGFSEYLERRLESYTEPAILEILRFFISEGRHNFKVLMNEPSNGLYLDTKFTALEALFPLMSREEICKRYIVNIESCRGLCADGIDYNCRLGYNITESMLKRDPGIQAIFYKNDDIALGGVKCITDRGLIVGKDIAAAGMNNIPTLAFHPFPISSTDSDIMMLADILIRESMSEEPFQQSYTAKAIIRRFNEKQK